MFRKFHLFLSTTQQNSSFFGQNCISCILLVCVGWLFSIAETIAFVKALTVLWGRKIWKMAQEKSSTSTVLNLRKKL
jgi:hypothetical protein